MGADGREAPQRSSVTATGSGADVNGGAVSTQEGEGLAGGGAATGPNSPAAEPEKSSDTGCDEEPCR